MKSHVIQSSFLSGVLDPRAAGRVETDAYNNGLLVGENIKIHHLGGAFRRPGTVYVDTLPSKLERLTGIALTTPNGGTPANADDDDEATVSTTTTPVGTTTPFVVAHIDIGGAPDVLFADVVNIQSTSGSSTLFRIQHSQDNSAWTDFGSPFELVDFNIPRTYRRVGPVAARYWRVVRIGSADMGAANITLTGFNLWSDTGVASEVRVIPFDIDTAGYYVVALTDRTASIYQGLTLIDTVATPYDDEDLSEIDAASDGEDMILVHDDYPPQFLVRESLSNFQRTAVVFDSIPQFDYDDGLSPTPVTDTQVITFAGSWPQGGSFQIELEGARTAVIIFAGDATADERAATAENIAREVQKLYTVKGYTGVACTRTGTGQYTVNLGGDSAANYKLMSVSNISGSGTATVVKTANGVTRQENIFSALRGYPRTVTFYQNRLVFGGMKSAKRSIIASIVGAPLDFDLADGLDDEALFVTLRGQKQINCLLSGRSLQVMTAAGEFLFSKNAGGPITPGEAPVNQTQYGAAKVRPVSVDGSTLFVELNRKAIRDFKYNYEEDAYDSLSVSALAPHLINGAVDMFAWRGSIMDEISLVFVVNSDGTMAILNSRKENNVRAWMRWTTDGAYKAGAAVFEDVYFAVARTHNNVTRVYLERMSEDVYTDCTARFTGAFDSVITGLDHLNGIECRVKADGFVLANGMPAAGQITIDRPSNQVDVGLNYNPILTPMPLNTVTQSSDGTSNFMRKRRIVKVRVKVKDTLGLLINGRVIPDRAFDIDLLGAPAEPVTRNHEIEETTNWDQREDKLVTLSQVDPVPMNILGIDIQLEGSQ